MFDIALEFSEDNTYCGEKLGQALNILSIKHIPIRNNFEDLASKVYQWENFPFVNFSYIAA